MFHQELHNATLRATAKAFITVSFRIDDEGTERSVAVEWAQSLVSDSSLLQTGAVVRSVAAEAFLNDLFDLRFFQNLVDDLLVDFRHSLKKK